MKRGISIVTAVCSLTVLAPAFAADWPQWRGPEGLGVTSEKGLPLTWTTNENVVWKAPLPDRGNSTPVTWGKRVFITQATEKRRTTMCFDANSGKMQWQSGVDWADKEPTHGDNPFCSASPATDGERVISSYGSAGLYCYDMQGKELWKYDTGPQVHIWGNAASPTIHKDLVYLNIGPGENTRLVALDKKTGNLKWEHKEAGGNSGEKKGEDGKAVWVGSWSTPVIIDGPAGPELIMPWPNRVVSHDPKTGKENWQCKGLNPLVYTSILYSDGVVVAMGGYSGSALAVRTGGKGDVTETHRLWHRPKSRQRIGSGVVKGDHIYMLTDPGIAECIELKTGKFVWEERLKGPGAKGDSWSSAVLSGDHVYLVNQSGDTFVIEARPTFKLLATNSLNERTMSSIAPADRRLFLRTWNHLWCLGDRRMAAAE